MTVNQSARALEKGLTQVSTLYQQRAGQTAICPTWHVDQLLSIKDGRTWPLLPRARVFSDLCSRIGDRLLSLSVGEWRAGES